MFFVKQGLVIICDPQDMDVLVNLELNMSPCHKGSQRYPGLLYDIKIVNKPTRKINA